jgi:hypothetical protein
VISGSRVMVTVVTVVLATAVVPPAGAWWLNNRRVQRTQERATVVAAQLVPGVQIGVVCGPGRLPDATVAGAGPVHAAWLSASRRSDEVLGADTPTDAWGRCFLVNDHWVVSAGPNGALDTPLDAATLVGDDVGVRRP